jgi:hypothetical protein
MKGKRKGEGGSSLCMSDDHTSCHTMSCTAVKQALLQGIGLSCDPSSIPRFSRSTVCCHITSVFFCMLRINEHQYL